SSPPPVQVKEESSSVHNSSSGDEEGKDEQIDDIDETSLFQEIDRELSNLLSGLSSYGQHAATQQASTASPMIPCSELNQTMALEKPGDSLRFESWCEALINDPSAVMEQSCFGAKNHQNQPDEPFESVPDTDGVQSAELFDATTLEESSKILAEVPSIFSGFLEDGKLQDKPTKKLRFVESEAESLVNGVMERGSDESDATKEEVAQDTQQTEATGHESKPKEKSATDASDRCSAAGETDPTDVFSCQFENILESERMQGTLYNSMDSLDALSTSTSAPQPPTQITQDTPFAFDIPLTPMIQQRLRDRSLFLDDPGSDTEVLSVSSVTESGKTALELISTSPSEAHVEPYMALANGVKEGVPKDWHHGCF
ncbi:hypothetical protein DNTS_028931, partial [Danionella cerebrum]